MQSFRGSLLSYIGSSRNADSDLLKLDANKNYFVDPKFLKNILLEALEEVDLRLYDPSVAIELREALAKYLNVPAECVWFGSGSEHLIDLFIQYFLTRNDEAISIVSFTIAILVMFRSRDHTKLLSSKNSLILAIPPFHLNFADISEVPIRSSYFAYSTTPDTNYPTSGIGYYWTKKKISPYKYAKLFVALLAKHFGEPNP